VNFAMKNISKIKKNYDYEIFVFIGVKNIFTTLEEELYIF
jgi:hypothetical protein